LARGAVEPVPSIYRMLVRRGLIEPVARRCSCGRWMMGGLFLASGAEAGLVTGIDDHSRSLVIAVVVPRATTSSDRADGSDLAQT